MMVNRLGYLLLVTFSLLVAAAQGQRPQPKPIPASSPAIRQDRPGRPPQEHHRVCCRSRIKSHPAGDFESPDGYQGWWQI